MDFDVASGLIGYAAAYGVAGILRFARGWMLVRKTPK